MEQQFGKKPLLTKQEPICLSGDVASLFVPRNVAGWKVSADRTTEVRECLCVFLYHIMWVGIVNCCTSGQYIFAAHESDGSPYSILTYILLSLQISKSELDLPLYEPEYAQFSGYPPTIHLTISHMPPSAHDQIEQMETDCKLKVLGLKEEVEFCLPLPKACAKPVALMNSGLPSAHKSSKHFC